MSRNPLYYDGFRFVIEEARTGRIITRDLEVDEPRLLRQLSGPCTITFKIDPRKISAQDPDTGRPITFKPWGHWCHVEKVIGETSMIMFSGLFQPSTVDDATGVLDAEFTGFSNYPTGIPWLQNWNPIAVDPFEIFHRVWDHIQSYENGDLGVEIYPELSGTRLLPGFSFNGSNFLMDFFAIFIRSVDYTDCGEYLNKLARDIPFDYFEQAAWNSDRTAIEKKIELAYPKGGVFQENLSFRKGENVIDMTPKTEGEIEWTSDILIRGWFPGKVYSHTLSNADPTRYRRTVVEEDAKINSNERAKALAKRQLSRRQVPHYWEKIVVKMYHSNAPLGSYDVGDSILVTGPMPWVGDVSQVHKIMAIGIDGKSQTVELSLRSEGAFNYDPIVYEGPEANQIVNPSFVSDLSGWTVTDGIGDWSRDPVEGVYASGSARVVCNGGIKQMISSPMPVEHRDLVMTGVSSKWVAIAATGMPLQVMLLCYNGSGTLVNAVTTKSLAAEQPEEGGSSLWTYLEGARYKIPSGITSVRLGLRVNSFFTSGTVWFDQAFLSKDS